MRHLAMLLYVSYAMLACAPSPAYVSCESPATACADGCVDVNDDPFNCGACGNECPSTHTCELGQCVPPAPLDGCAIGNGGCSADAFCMDIAGSVMCACLPGFTGDGTVCAACSACDPTQFVSMACSPASDTQCAACSVPCMEGTFESVPCGPTDRTCTACTQCTIGTYQAAPCDATSDRVCAPCEQGCLSCGGPGATCFVCDVGLVLMAGACVPAVCGDGVRDGTEECDDGNTAAGDGCSDFCMIEAGNYCFGDPLSICRAGTCDAEPATALPLGAGFSLDGAGTASAAGLQLTQRSLIRTTAAVSYPVLVEMTVVYSGNDVTYAGTRGDGLRDGTASDEPTDGLRARLSATTVELATGPGTTVIAATPSPFFPTPGIPYRVRFVDDGLIATVEWFNLTNPAEGVGLQQMTSYHGSDDRAFVGGGDQGAVTVSDIRVCSAPSVPVTAGLVAHYSAIPSWTAVRDNFDIVSSWQDLSSGGHTLSAGGVGPIFGGGQIVGQRPGVSFNGGTQLSTSAFALTTDVSVFAVVHHTTPAQWGAIAHHGSRDSDWSLEQSGDTGDPNTLHWQTNNDNVNMDLTLTANTSYVLTGIFDGNSRYFAASSFDGSVIAPVSIVDVSHSITAGIKQMFVGSSDNNEASNAVIGELVYFNRALSTAERDSVIAYLRALWRPQ